MSICPPRRSRGGQKASAGAGLARDAGCAAGCYLTVPVAPAPSSWALAFSAVSLLTRSRTGFGAPSTRSLASLRPRLVRVRTSLITWIFLSPAASRTTSNSSFSSPGAAPGPVGRRPGPGDRGRGLDVERLLELLYELRELEQRHLLERVE